MAKKGAVVQLQIDVTTDEEWEKLISRDGLIVIDVYSDWCGPCSAMNALLRKIKLEQGEDFLQLATAKADGITCLKRFVGKSEPTWMFMAQGQMIELLFGANAPLLQRTILDQMKKEKECLDNKRVRILRPPDTFSDEEKGRYEAIERREQLLQKLALDKKRKLLTERRTAQAKNILDTMAHLGVILLFPHAIKKGPELLEDFWPESGLTPGKKERPRITQEALEDIEFFSPYKIQPSSVEHLIQEKSLAIMITQDESVTTPIDETIVKFIYGHKKVPPGEAGTPAYILMKKIIQKAESIEDTGSKINPSEFITLEGKLSNESTVTKSKSKSTSFIFGNDLTSCIDGVWAPANDLVKATALKYFFPLITSPLIIPEGEPAPPHVAVAFDTLKRREILDFAKDYENDLLCYGYFTSQDIENAKFIAKTTALYEMKHKETERGEKLILKVSRKKSDAILAFAQLGPTYISPNVFEGERECSVFFPEGYEDIVEDVPVEAVIPKPKPTKRIVSEVIEKEDVSKMLLEDQQIEIPEVVEIPKFLPSQGVEGIEYEDRDKGVSTVEEDLMGLDVDEPLNEFGEQMTGMPEVEGIDGFTAQPKEGSVQEKSLEVEHEDLQKEVSFVPQETPEFPKEEDSHAVVEKSPSDGIAKSGSQLIKKSASQLKERSSQLVKKSSSKLN